MRFPRLVIVLCILLAAGLRLHGLAEQGFFMFDEARFVLDARELRAQGGWAATHGLDLARGQDVPEFHHRDFAEGTARPLHVLILALLGADATRMLFFQALAGILLVPAVAALAERLASRPTPDAHAFTTPTADATAGYAAFLVALSPALTFWSRTLLAEIDAALPFILFLLLLSSERRARTDLAAGFLAGLALAVQSRMALILPVALLLDLIAHRSPARLARIALGIVIPLLVLQSGSLVLKATFSASGQGARVETYLEQFLNRAAIDGGGFALNRPFFGLRYLALVEGPVWTILALVSATLLLVRQRTEAGPWLVAGTFLWTVVLATTYDQHRFSGERYGRMLAPAVPLGAALIGHLLGRLRVRRKALALVTLLALVVIRPVALAPIAGMHSDQGAILAEAARRTGSATAWSEEPLHVAVHLGADSFPARFLPRSDTLTVVIMDERHARNFGFWRFLPDTPAFRIARRGHVQPPLVRLEIANHRDDFTLDHASASPAAVYVLGPDSTVVP